jgi:hypothetical protein
LLLVAGGALDPHLDRVIVRLRARELPHEILRVGQLVHPRLTVRLDDGELQIDGRVCAPSSVLLRHDVFSWLADQRPAVSRRATTWWESLAGWLLLREEVRTYNRAYLRTRTHKLHALARARHHGLQVPDTVLSNDISLLETRFQQVAKPISGGRYCVPLDHALAGTSRSGDALPAPALVQERLGAPELRVYLIGPTSLTFEVRSAHLDYRADPASTVHPHPGPPDAVLRGLRALADELGLDCCAADFKTSPHTGELCFLEINAQPMWEAYDQISGGAVADALIDGLLTPTPA